MNNLEISTSLTNPVVTLLTDEDDGNLSPNDISLREAVLYSNDGDTISFDPSLQNETISLTLGGIRIDKSLTIQGFESSQLTIDANNLSRIFLISDRSRNLTNVTLNHLTLTGGNAEENDGGAIANVERLTINDSLITANSGRSGGAIYTNSVDSLESRVVLNDSEVSNNSATNGGGGIFVSSNGYGGDDPPSLVVRNSVISGNTDTGWYGGGIYASPPIAVIDSAIEQNQAKYLGGGIYNSANAQIISSTIDGNAAENGGGIASEYVEISGSTISNNEAVDSGGGVSLSGFDGFISISNSTVSNNTAAVAGGGIRQDAFYGSGIVSNTTITGNSASVGGGLKAENARVRVSSSIIAENVDNNDVSGSEIISEGNNFIGNGDDTGDFEHRFNGDLVGTAAEPLDPGLGELQDNGGNTLTHALLPGSPAINRGSNPDDLTNDQRGEGFERVLFAEADIGAVEADTDAPDNLPVLPPEPMERVVTTLDDESDDNLALDDLSLREALTIANPGDTIAFDPSLSGGTIILNAGELNITSELTIRGLGADNLTINGNDVSRVFNIDDSSGNAADVIIEDLTITGGRAIEGGGGGISNRENLTVNRVKITDNTADNSGGGISTKDGASTTINYSTISGNTVEGNGGGISNYSASTTVNYSTISGNSADLRGGGISTVSFYGGSVTVNNSTISGNSAVRYGGGIDGFDSIANINNSTITDNSAAEGGSGVALDFASGTITSSIIAGNQGSVDFFGSAISGGNNLIGSSSSSAFVDNTREDIVGTTEEPLVPQLEALEDNGGLTQTHALLPDSLAINAGRNPEEFTTDQRGEGFERVLFEAPDIGSLEADTDHIQPDRGIGGNPIVTTLEDEDDGDLTAGDISLREAILYSDRGDTITFDPRLSGGTISLELGELAIVQDLSIEGLGADNLTIDANGTNRVLKVDDGIYDSSDISLSGLTITGGTPNDFFYGGGIHNQENLTITDSIVSNNVSERGGGIYNNGTLEIESSIITGNSAAHPAEALYRYSYGGGIYSADRFDGNNNALTIKNSTISGNSAAGNGGGISIQGGGYDNSGVSIIINSTISGNSAAGNGAGAYIVGRDAEISNSTIANNVANSRSAKGSGIYHRSFNDSSMTLTSTIVAGNIGDPDLDGTPIVSGGNNLIGKLRDATIFDSVDSDFVGTVDAPIINQLEPLADNGGSTPTHALLPTSVAIDAGSNLENLTSDQRGLERSRRQTDIGAFESQVEIVVNEIDGSDGNDVIVASNNDLIRGGNGIDTIYGLEGNDTLLGGQQFDRLYGGTGDDILDGGQGIEVLTGGSGSDLFYLNDLDNIAWIMDFELGNDTLGLAEGISFNDLEITGTVNSFISYEGDLEAYPEGNRFAVLLGVDSVDLDNLAFTTV